MFNWFTKHKSSKTRRIDRRGDYPQMLITKPTSSKKNKILTAHKLKDSGELRKDIEKEKDRKEKERKEQEEDESIVLKGGKRKRRKSRRNK
jgi:hypothetical protein